MRSRAPDGPCWRARRAALPSSIHAPNAGHRSTFRRTRGESFINTHFLPGFGQNYVEEHSRSEQLRSTVVHADEPAPQQSGLLSIYRAAHVSSVLICAALLWRTIRIVGDGRTIHEAGGVTQHSYYLWTARVSVALAVLVPLGWVILRTRLRRTVLPFGVGSHLASPRTFIESFAVYMVSSEVGWHFLKSSADHPLSALRYALFAAPGVALAWAAFRAGGWTVIRMDIGWRKGASWARELGLGVLAGLVCLSVGGATLWIVDATRLNLAAAHQPDSLCLLGATGLRLRDDLTLLALIVVLVPVLEETVYRGVLYRGLRGWLSWPRAAVITAAVFGLGHSPWQNWPAHVATGFMYALMREWRGSLIAAIVAHSTYNLGLRIVAWSMFAP